MTTDLLVRFTRSPDADDALPTVSAHLAGAHLADDGIAVVCEQLEEADVKTELRHAVDEWLVERQLPFSTLELDEHTLLVCPPGD